MLNILSFLNELSVSLYLYLALLLSDYLESQFISIDGSLDPLTVRTNLTWTLTLLLCIVIFVNSLYALVVKIIDLATCISRRKK